MMGPAMKRRTLLVLISFALLLSVREEAPGQFKEVSQEYQRNYPQFMAAFKDTVARSSQSTVRVQCDSKDVALGMVIFADGWVLTKANDLGGNISCRFRDGRVYEAKLMGVHAGHDLAVLKISARGLTPVDFKHSKTLGAGQWIACAGLSDEPVAIGIVSVATRTLTPKHPSDHGYLGVAVENVDGALRVVQVVADTPAAKAGLKVDDVLLSLQGKTVASADAFVDQMQLHKVGEVVAVGIKRGEKEMQFKATLMRRPLSSRGEVQNRMGSELSSRVTGYSTILQHDAVIRPRDCGGPIVDLEGKVIGINICRAGRTESWAVPTEAIVAVLGDLISGKLAPPPPVPGRSVNRSKEK